MMMNETLFFGVGECPIVRPEGIYYGGRKVISLGLRGVGLGDVGDLLAYRQEWEPFIAAHLNLWRDLNARLEAVSDAKNCPPGIFTAAQVQTLSDTLRAFCSALALTRIRTSDTDPGGILTQWNAWKDKSAADMVAGAATFLQWHQNVVMRVGKDYAKDLLQIAQAWNIPVQLPDVPSFSAQQELKARIEGAYVTAKGVVQLIGYSAGELLGEARDLTDAVAKGLTDGAKAIPKALNWALIVGAVAVAVVAGGLIIYYVPRQPRQSAPVFGK